MYPNKTEARLASANLLASAVSELTPTQIAGPGPRYPQAHTAI